MVRPIMKWQVGVCEAAVSCGVASLWVEMDVGGVRMKMEALEDRALYGFPSSLFSVRAFLCSLPFRLGFLFCCRRPSFV